MTVGEPALGLRDRKKIQTRDTIRREAMRLIKANGYASTTIEQIEGLLLKKTLPDSMLGKSRQSASPATEEPLTFLISAASL